MYEDDFVKTFMKEVHIDGRKFTLKVLNGPEYDKFLDSIKYYDEVEGKFKFSLAKRNEFYLKNCVLSAPYEWNGKEWGVLSSKERLECLNSLKNSIRKKIILECVKINEGGDLAKK